MDLGLGEGLVGLSLLGDLGGAVSNYFQQQRQRNLYKKLTDPAAMAGYANAYAQNIYNTTSPQIARQAAGALGAGGVADGAYGNSLMQQSLANYMGQLQQQGANAYTQNLAGATNNVGPTFGSSGASMDALKTLMMMQMLGKGGGGSTQPSLANQPAISGPSSASNDYFNLGTAGMDNISNPLTYQFTPASFEGF